jgi:CRP-like cAMP-binding protein
VTIERSPHAMRRVLFLKRLPLLAELHTSDLALLAEGLEEHFSPRGTVLLRAGEPVRAIHFVLQGRVRVARRGRELGFADAGSVIGGGLLLAQDADGLEAVAEADTTSLSLGREAILDALEERFEIFLRILREPCRELVGLFQRFPGEAAPPAPARPPPPLSGRDLGLVERIVLLGRMPLWAYSLDALAELSQRLEEVRRPQGSVLWRSGERATRMLFVASGRVRCELPGAGGTFLVGPGQPLGAVEALGQLPRWHDAIAEEPVTALEGDVDELVDVLEDDAENGLGLLSHLVKHSVEILERAGGSGEPLRRLVGGEGLHA